MGRLELFPFLFILKALLSSIWLRLCLLSLNSRPLTCLLWVLFQTLQYLWSWVQNCRNECQYRLSKHVLCLFYCPKKVVGGIFQVNAVFGWSFMKTLIFTGRHRLNLVSLLWEGWILGNSLQASTPGRPHCKPESELVKLEFVPSPWILYLEIDISRKPLSRFEHEIRDNKTEGF